MLNTAKTHFPSGIASKSSTTLVECFEKLTRPPA